MLNAMLNNASRRGSLSFLAVLILQSACASAFGQRNARPPVEAPDPRTGAAASTTPAVPAAGAPLNKVLDGYNRVRAAIATTNGEKPPEPVKTDADVVVAHLEDVELGSINYGSSSEQRYLVAKLMLANLSAEPVTVERGDIALTVNGKSQTLGDVPERIAPYSIRMGDTSKSIRGLKPATKMKLAPGAARWTWVVFGDLPKGNNTPDLELTVKTDKTPIRINVVEYAAGLAGITVEAIGPRDSLALVTISGELNSAASGALADRLDKLAARKVTRVVIRWTKDAAPLDATMNGWLQHSAFTAGITNKQNTGYHYNFRHLPEFPATMTEVHLSGIPKKSSTSYSFPNQQGAAPRIHKSDVDAVSAALYTAFEVLPPDDLLKEIEHGHPLTRAAALAIGGGRLPQDKLPLILEHASSDDLQMRRAALRALGRFGDKAALDALADYARSDDDETAAAALAGLAQSRYAAAWDVLLGLLKDSNSERRRRIVKVLAHYPRTLWSDVIYDFVDDPDPALSREAVRALVQVGHPKLVDVLSRALESTNTELRDDAFKTLAARRDGRSEELALEFTLKELEVGTFRNESYALLSRTRDPRALPLLMKRYETSNPKNSDSRTVNLLAMLGDADTAERITARYPKLSGSNKRYALDALLKLKSPEYVKLARAALLSGDSSLASSASRGLQQVGGREAINALIEALEQSKKNNVWSYAARALGYIATDEAREALIKARDSDNKSKSNAAKQGLRYAWDRSPANQLTYSAANLAQQKKWKEAIELYGKIIEMDPMLPKGWAGRGDMYLMQKKHKEAAEDYRKAVKLDPYNTEAAGGLAVVLTAQDKHEEAVKQVEDSLKEVSKSGEFHLRVARVYSRAFEYAAGNKQLADRDRKIADWRKKAFENLTQAVKSGQRDFASIRKEADFKPLMKLKQFDKIIGPAVEKKPKDGEKAAAGAAEAVVEEVEVLN